MVIDANSIAIVLATSFISGAATAIVASISDNKKEKKRIAERDQDHLKMDLKEILIIPKVKRITSGGLTHRIINRIPV